VKIPTSIHVWPKWNYKAMADAIDLKLFKKDENQWQRESGGSRSQLGVRILGSLAVF